jgi:hypothetical protein
MRGSREAWFPNGPHARRGSAWLVLVLMFGCALAAPRMADAQSPATPGPAVLDTSYAAPDGTRVLRQSLAVSATSNRSGPR